MELYVRPPDNTFNESIVDIPTGNVACIYGLPYSTRTSAIGFLPRLLIYLCAFLRIPDERRVTMAIMGFATCTPPLKLNNLGINFFGPPAGTDPNPDSAMIEGPYDNEANPLQTIVTFLQRKPREHNFIPTDNGGMRAPHLPTDIAPHLHYFTDIDITTMGAYFLAGKRNDPHRTLQFRAIKDSLALEADQWFQANKLAPGEAAEMVAKHFSHHLVPITGEDKRKTSRKTEQPWYIGIRLLEYDPIIINAFTTPVPDQQLPHLVGADELDMTFTKGDERQYGVSTYNLAGKFLPPPRPTAGAFAVRMSGFRDNTSIQTVLMLMDKEVLQHADRENRQAERQIHGTIMGGEIWPITGQNQWEQPIWVVYFTHYEIYNYATRRIVVHSLILVHFSQLIFITLSQCLPPVLGRTAVADNEVLMEATWGWKFVPRNANRTSGTGSINNTIEYATLQTQFDSLKTSMNNSYVEFRGLVENTLAHQDQTIHQMASQMTLTDAQVGVDRANNNRRDAKYALDKIEDRLYVDWFHLNNFSLSQPLPTLMHTPSLRSYSEKNAQRRAKFEADLEDAKKEYATAAKTLETAEQYLEDTRLSNRRLIEIQQTPAAKPASRKRRIRPADSSPAELQNGPRTTEAME
ncbi:hypothetical protein P7C70_g5124, partial [Phenoliferia sp. Uapishka_3]